MDSLTAQQEQATKRADAYLAYVRDAVESVGELLDVWDTMDDIEQETHLLDWSVPRDRMFQLRAWARQGWLTEEQRQQLASLEALVAEKRAMLEPLFSLDSPADTSR